MSAVPSRLPSARPLLRLGLLAAAAAVAGVIAPPPASARSEGLGQIVRAVCLSAFENEVAQAGKKAPAGMADYACGCVADRIQSGSSLDAARSTCRQLTARRFPI